MVRKKRGTPCACALEWGGFRIRVKSGHKPRGAQARHFVRQGLHCWTRGHPSYPFENARHSGRRRPTLFRTPEMVACACTQAPEAQPAQGDALTIWTEGVFRPEGSL